MSKDKELDDFDLDNFDLGDFDGGVDGGNSDRNPVASFGKSFLDGALGEVSRPENVAKALKKNLPRGYADAGSELTKAFGDVRQFQREAEKALGPTVKDLKKSVGGLLPKAKGFLGEKTYKRLESALSTDDDRPSGPSPDAIAMGGAMSEIFGKDAEARNNELLAKMKVDGVNHKEAMKGNMLINRSLMSLVNYQDTVTAKFQQKSLELSYKHYFAARDLLAVQKAANVDIINALNGIQKNSGLPDWKKLQSNEAWDEHLQQRTFSGVTGLLGASVSGYTDKFKDNIRQWGIGKIDQLKSGLETANTMLGMAGTMGEMSEMTGGSNSDMAAGMGGGMAAGAGMNAALKKLAATLEKNPKFARGAAALKGKMDRMPNEIHETILRNAGDSAFWDLLAELAPKFDQKATIASNYKKDALTPASWDIASRRSIVEIIPGFLGRMNQHMETLATGKYAERLVYSADTEAFERFSTASSIASSKTVRSKEVKDFASALDSIMADIFKSGNVSKEAKQHFKEQLYADLKKGFGFHPSKYMDDFRWESFVPESSKAEIRAHLTSRFPQETEAEVDEINAVSAKFGRLAGAMPDFNDGLTSYGGLDQKELLRKAGWITKDGTRDVFNQARLDGMLIGGDGGSWDIAEGEYKPNQGPFGPGPTQGNGGSDTGGSWKNVDPFERAIGQFVEGAKASDLIRLQGNERLVEIRNILDRGIRTVEVQVDANTAGGSSVGSGWGNKTLGGLFNSAAGGISSGISGVKSLMGTAFGGATSLASGAMGAVGGAASHLKDLISQGIGIDVFLKGSGLTSPLMTAKGMREGRYHSVATGAVISSIKDIDGEVIDSLTQEIVVSKEDIARGLVNNRAIDLVWTKGGEIITIAGSTGSKLFGYAKDFATSFAGGAATSLTYIKDKVLGFIDDRYKLMDVYVKGMENMGPMLTSMGFRNNWYFNKDGTPINSIKDINGDVYNAEGELIVSIKDLSKGMIDKFGEAINVEGLLTSAIDAVNGGIKAVKGVFTSAFKWVSQGSSTIQGMFSSVFSSSSTMFVNAGTVYINASNIQGAGGDGEAPGRVNDDTIYVGPDGNAYTSSESGDIDIGTGSVRDTVAGLIRLIDKRMPDDSVKGDGDGDGLRDGGWRSQIRDRASGLRDRFRKDPADKKETGKGGMFAGLAGLFGLGKKGDDGEEGGGWLSDLADMADIGDFLNGDGGDNDSDKKGKGGKRKGLFGKLKGLLGAGAGAVGTGAGKISGLLKGGGKFAGKTALKAGAGAAVGGLAVGGVALAPIVGAGLAAWTAWEVASAGWDWFKGRREVGDLERDRMNQYGLGELTNQKVRAMRSLEEDLVDGLRREGDTFVLVGNLETITDDHIGSFVPDPDNKTQYGDFTRWLAYRVLPVLQRHVRVLYALAPDTKLSEVEELGSQTKADYMNAVLIQGSEKHKNYPHPYEIPYPDGSVVNMGDIQNYRIPLIASMDKIDLAGKPTIVAKVLTDRKAANDSNRYGQSNKKDRHVAVGAVAGGVGVVASNNNVVDIRGLNKDQSGGSNGGYIMPAEGRLSSKFGRRVHPVTGKTHGHGGIDIAAATGTPVVASSDGVVTVKRLSSSYGNVIYIKHPDGNYTRYAHLHNFADGIDVGSNVKQGEVIGYVGNTGVSTGPHLHFEIVKGPTNAYAKVDPMKMIKGEDFRKAVSDAKGSIADRNTEDTEAKKGGKTIEGVDTLGDRTNEDTVAKMKKDRVSAAVAKSNVTARQDAIQTQHSQSMDRTNNILIDSLRVQTRMADTLDEIKNATIPKAASEPEKSYPKANAKEAVRVATQSRNKAGGNVPISMRRVG